MAQWSQDGSRRIRIIRILRLLLHLLWCVINCFGLQQQSRRVDIVSKVHIYYHFVNEYNSCSIIHQYSAESAVLLVTHFMSLFAATHGCFYSPTHMGLKIHLKVFLLMWNNIIQRFNVWLDDETKCCEVKVFAIILNSRTHVKCLKALS